MPRNAPPDPPEVPRSVLLTRTETIDRLLKQASDRMFNSRRLMDTAQMLIAAALAAEDEARYRGRVNSRHR